ncbi:MAG: methyltransferase, TrmH family [Acidobacteriota bacterium]|jgi:TrmH family RNA methyltransferase|nr:methyltransferase, TrmH family [Acidobacteriota bacterium]
MKTTTKTITSRHNPLIKRMREAIREHKEEIVIEGPKPVADAIANGWKAISVLERGANISEEAFDSITETKHPQHVIGLFERPHANANDILARRDTIAVALDGVQDPGNVGTIIRLAAAFDASGVLLLPGCADAFGPKAIRSSAGAILSVPVARITLQELLDAQVPLFATAMDGTRSDPPAKNAVVIFGNEGAGVSAEVQHHATKLAVAMSQRVESLNVAATAAILLARSFALRSGVR